MVIFGTESGFKNNCLPYPLSFLNIELDAQNTYFTEFMSPQTSSTYQNYISNTTHLTSQKSHGQTKCICYFLE